MAHLAATLATAVGVFTGTNIDGFVLLIILFLGSRNGTLRPWQIVLGQYLVFIALLALSLVIALGFHAVPTAWVGLLGLLPLALGARDLRAVLRRHPAGAGSVRPARRARTAAVLMASVSADNLSVYAVLFRTQTAAELALTVLLFFVLLAVWCAAALAITTHKRAVAGLISVDRWLVPLVLIGIGAAILVRTGLIPEVTKLLSGGALVPTSSYSVLGSIVQNSGR